MYTIATLTCLALEIDPVTDQEQLRTHMIKCMEKGEIGAFPITKRHRLVATVGCLIMERRWCAVQSVVIGFTLAVLVPMTIRVVIIVQTGLFYVNCDILL